MADKDKEPSVVPSVDTSPTLNADSGSHSKHNWQGFKVQGGPHIQMCVVCGKSRSEREN